MGFFRWLSNVFGGRQATVAPVSKELRRPTSLMPPPGDPVRMAWDQLKSFVARCEAQSLDLAGLHVDDPIGFCAVRARIEERKLAGTSAEEATLAEGFSCVDHWVVVERYFQARYSELVRLPTGKVAVRYVEAFQRATERAEHQVNGERTRLEQAASLREPIAGVTLERFAEISAMLAFLGSDATRARTTEVLASFGIGAATFGSVRRGWETRMEGDSTKSLRRTFRAAWTFTQEQLASGKLKVAGTVDQEISKVSTRYTWVESMEARPEYRSSMMTG
ncbi:MAG: hypothetical protein IPG50_16315 [Myxococcales bacterium]|nr:hypothetical protein [Myxococcales bacterium]